MSKSEDPHELKSFEAKLSALVPRDDRLDRERLIFFAGQASMTANTNKSPVRVTGWQCHPAWPTAFAAMSVLAATFLLMLVTRPVITDMSASGVGDIAANRLQTTPQVASNVSPGKLVDTLSVGDALGGDIEQRIAKLSNVKSAPLYSLEPPETPSLTPAAWRRVSDDVRSPVPSAGSFNWPNALRGNS